MAILAFGGGMANITRRYLEATKQYTTFYQLINDHYWAVFGKANKAGANRSIDLEGCELPFVLPNTQFVNNGTAYYPCRPGRK